MSNSTKKSIIISALVILSLSFSPTPTSTPNSSLIHSPSTPLLVFDNDLIKNIIIVIIGYILGLFTSLINHRCQIIKDNKSAIREQLEKQISKIEDFITCLLEMDQLQTELKEIAGKMELLKEGVNESTQELQWIDDEILTIKKDQASVAVGNMKFEEISNRIDLLRSRTSEVKGLIGKRSHELSELSKAFEEQSANLKNYKSRISKDDIDATALIIDPTGSLSLLINELEKLFLNIETHFFSNKQAIIIRRDISNLLNHSINKIK